LTLIGGIPQIENRCQATFIYFFRKTFSIFIIDYDSS